MVERYYNLKLAVEIVVTEAMPVDLNQYTAI